MEEYRDEEYREEEFPEDETQDGKKRTLRILLIILALLLIIGGAVYTGYYLYGQYLSRVENENYSTIAVTEESTSAEETKKPKNPVDFAKLQKKNPEIYAWLKVPGTKVDYPIVQSAKDDAFYLKHSALDQSWLSSGAIYTEMLNTKDFTDRVTVIYGHNGYSDTMFTTLHKFENAEFFDSHEHFYIYTPGEKRTYEIVSAFKYDDRHLLNSFQFQYDEVFTEFLTMIQNPETGVMNLRKNLDRTLTIEDNIVVLSTCIRNQSSKRYLVCGVLISNEQTN